MSNYLKYATEASDSYFAGLTETQESFLKSIAAFTTFLPAVPAQLAQGAGDLPTVQEITEASFSFAQRFLKKQQEFFEKAISASTPPGTANAMAMAANAMARNAQPKNKSAPAS